LQERWLEVVKQMSRIKAFETAMVVTQWSARGAMQVPHMNDLLGNSRAWKPDSVRRGGMRWCLRGVEALEVRRALAGDGWVVFEGPGWFEETAGFFEWSPISFEETISIQEVAPSLGATLRSSPRVIEVRVDRALDAGSLMGEDLRLERLGDDGSVRVVAGEGVNDLVPTLDASGTLASYEIGRLLEPGRYRVVLTSRAFWFSTDGAMLPFTVDEPVLTEFAVEAESRAEPTEVDLGVLGSEVRSVSGELDLAEHPLDVAYYRFTLPAGHFWRVGAELYAERGGSALRGAISLFGPDGVLIARSVLGRPSHPNDPYMFAGLQPGSYVIGVSGAGNLPGAVGEPGSSPDGVSFAISGGAYTLQLVADAVDDAPRVVSFELDRADAWSRQATGFTIQFSRAIRDHVMSEGIMDGISGGLELADEAGRVWPLVPSGYDEAQARVSYVFERRLPTGVYTVRLSRGGAGLADLAGIAPRSQNPAFPADVLGRFRILPQIHRKADGDLGAATPEELAEGMQIAASLGAGETRSWRFVNILPELMELDFRGTVSDATVLIRRRAEGGGSDVEVARLESGSRALVQMAQGEYEIVMTNGGEESAEVILGMRIPTLSWEVILGSGVGQGAALGLRLIAPSPGMGLPGRLSTISAVTSSTEPGGLGIGPAQTMGVPGMATGPVGSGESGSGLGARGGDRGGVVIAGGEPGVSLSIQAFAQTEQAAVGRPISTPQLLSGGATGQNGVYGPFVVITTGSTAEERAGGLALTDANLLSEPQPGRPEEPHGRPGKGVEQHPESPVVQQPARDAEVVTADAEVNQSPLAVAVDEILARFWFPMKVRTARADAATEMALIEAPEVLAAAGRRSASGDQGREPEAEFAGFGSPLDAGVAMLGILQARRFWARWKDRRGSRPSGGIKGSKTVSKRPEQSSGTSG
jgi:hypothetical protein